MNLQLGEVARDGSSLAPVPAEMTRLDEYTRILGRQSRTCSAKGKQLGIGIWVQVSTADCGVYDLCLHDASHPESAAMTTARVETKRLAYDMHDDICQAAGLTRDSRTDRVLDCVVAALAMQGSEIGQPAVVSEDQAARLGSALVSSGCVRIEDLALVDANILLEMANTVQPPIEELQGIMRRTIVCRCLHQTASDWVANGGTAPVIVKSSSNEVENHGGDRSTISASDREHFRLTRLNLGGLDILGNRPVSEGRPVTNALTQDDQGCLTWLGVRYQRCDKAAVPTKGTHGWLGRVAVPKLRHLEQHLFMDAHAELFLRLDLLEVWDDDSPRQVVALRDGVDLLAHAPMLFYQRAKGETATVDAHPGQLWEIYRPHGRRAIFCVDAIVEYAGRMQRKTVYTSDERHSLGLAVDFDFGYEMRNQKPLSETTRFQAGYLFAPLFATGSDFTTNPPEPTFYARRSRPEAWKYADRRACEAANVVHLLSDEWSRQELIPSEVLKGILPRALIEAFEFWGTGPRLLFGYRRSDYHLERQQKIKRAIEFNNQQKLAKARKAAWYDGILIIVELTGENNDLAIVRRAPWDEPGQTEKGASSVIPMTLLNAEHASVKKDGLLEQIIALLTRLTSAGEILCWSAGVVDADGKHRPAIKPGDEVDVSEVQIPLLNLTFQPRLITRPGRSGVGNSRFYRLESLDFAGKFVCDNAISRALHDRHIPHVRHCIW